MEFVIGLIGVLAILLGIYEGYQLSQAIPDIAGSLANPLIAMQFAGPLSLVIGGIVMLAFATGLHLLRQIRNHAERTAAYLSNIARGP
jgi:hypothetical protein